MLSRDFWRETVSETTLGRRAWCLQERVLSNAIIHFGKRQIAWECNGGDFCETFPKGLPNGLQDEYARFILFSAEDGRSLRLENRPVFGRFILEVQPISSEGGRNQSGEAERIIINDAWKSYQLEGVVEGDKQPNLSDSERDKVSAVKDDEDNNEDNNEDLRC